jgi:uncharacterized protein YheU (UPF0270 family)
MEIPFTELTDEALRGVIEEFVSREGTDYGSIDFSFEENIKQIKGQLMAGDIKLVFDAETHSCSLVQVS